MHGIYYWRPDNYQRDRRFGFGFHLNQGSAVLPEIRPGESVWAFTRNNLGQYVLAAELIVRAITKNAPNYRYGQHRVWGDLHDSRYFDIDGVPNAEPLIRQLSPAPRANVLAQSFQGHRAVKRISELDHQILTAFAATLREIEPGGIYPEDGFEARLALGPAALDWLLEETDSKYSTRTSYLYESLDITRARRHVEWLHTEYEGRCQICQFHPRDRYGFNLCHGHHIEWLSRGGEDELENMALLCPNHHAAVHADDAPFDYASLSFSFKNGLSEPLLLNKHLARAA
ncbi:MAG: HNH endonuclease [Longimicrobiales bacterium]